MKARISGALAGFLFLSLVSCDFSVTNPGPVPDAALDTPAASEAIVNGMGRTFSRALGWVSLTGGIVSREIVASGTRNVALYGVSLKQRSGLLDPGLEETNEHWKLLQQSRWIAEDGIRRMRVTLGPDFDSSPFAAQALVYAGFANRLLGENVCVGIIDGGPAEPRTVYFTRARDAFTEAIAVARAAGNENLERAAIAGRASVRVWLDDWTGAVADAQNVPAGFRYQATYSAQEQVQSNRIYWSNSNQPERAHSVVGTFYETYYLNTGDPRTPWSTNPDFPRGTVNVLWYFQTKFDSQASPVNLVTSREMRLLIAESRLRSGDWQGAMTDINALRSEAGVEPWSASSVAEAWTTLGRERGIELWLEGRRLGDLWRWKQDNVPGTFENMTGRDLCFPVGVIETDANPNL